MAEMLSILGKNVKLKDDGRVYSTFLTILSDFEVTNEQMKKWKSGYVPDNGTEYEIAAVLVKPHYSFKDAYSDAEHMDVTFYLLENDNGLVIAGCKTQEQVCTTFEFLD